MSHLRSRHKPRILPQQRSNSTKLLNRHQDILLPYHRSSVVLVVAGIASADVNLGLVRCGLNRIPAGVVVLVVGSIAVEEGLVGRSRRSISNRRADVRKHLLAEGSRPAEDNLAEEDLVGSNLGSTLWLKLICDDQPGGVFVGCCDNGMGADD